MSGRWPKVRDATPVLLLAGRENALAVARSFHRFGIPVRVASDHDSVALRSRYLTEAFPAPKGMHPSEAFAEVTLSGKFQHLHGSVVFACGDEAIEFMIDNRVALEDNFLLDCHIPELQRQMLNKQRTVELAESVGVPGPRLWHLDDGLSLEAVGDDATFPVLIKPIFSHLFQQHFNSKLIRVDDRASLLSRGREVEEKGLDFMVCEFIPGPDTCNSSYYTHLDVEGNALFHFTKRVIRRRPPNFGSGCYHETKWLPETAELGERFFRGIGFQGLCNVEFKRDPRDGQLKIIECNARITAAHELLVRAGIDTAYLVYCHLTGRAVPDVDEYTERVTLLYPLADWHSFRVLRARHELSLFGWIRSLARRQHFPYLSIRDPVPFLLHTWRNYRGIVRRLWQRLVRR